MYIETCTFNTLYHLCIKQYIVNNKHVAQERSKTEYDHYKYSDLICIEKMLFLTFI